MKPKQIIILAVILGILILGVAVQKFKKPAELQTEEYSTLDFNFDASKASKIVIQKGESEKLVELTKEGDNWKVSNFLNASADRVKIDGFLKQIGEVKGELRGKDKSIFSDFKISDTEAYRIVISDQAGAALSELLLGAKRSVGSTFIRKSGTDSVYYVRTDLFGGMGFYGDLETDKPKSDYWVSLKPFDLKADQLEKLEITRFKDGKPLVLANILREIDPADNAKRTWKFVRPEVPFPLDPEKISQFLTSTSNWYASKALDPKEKDYGFSKPSAQMKLIYEGQKEIVITAAQENAEAQSIYVQISGEPVVFEYSGSFLKQLGADDSKFLGINFFDAEADKVEQLNIKTADQNLNFSPKAKKWDSLTNYINNDLKNMPVSRLLFDSAEQKKAQGARHSVKITKEGGTAVALEVGELLGGTEKEYAAKIGNAQPFAISEATFKLLFENLGRLSEPKS